MDSSEFPTGRPSPRQLQGPRPTPLKVRKDSYKINKKPPLVPNPCNPPPPNPRPPVIIYTVSPKIIHTNPSDFMTLVQRLTGPDSSTDPSLPSPSAALSPAARFAAIEKAEKSSPRKYNNSGMDDVIDVEGESGLMLDRTNSIPGILSPIPSSLPPISSSFFSPISSFDPGSLSFLHDLSPWPAGFHGGSSSISNNNNLLVSPNYNFLSTPTVPSPGSCWDLFNQFQDL